MSRFELYSTDPETGSLSLFTSTDSESVAERWERDGGVAIDTSLLTVAVLP